MGNELIFSIRAVASSSGIVYTFFNFYFIGSLGNTIAKRLLLDYQNCVISIQSMEMLTKMFFFVPLLAQIEVEDSGVPRMKSEHTVTIMVLDENDSPSTSRSVHAMVHSLNGQTPLGKIADVHPNDPDTSGDYTCKILHGSNPGGVLSIPIGCDLHTSKITPGTCLGKFIN